VTRLSGRRVGLPGYEWSQRLGNGTGRYRNLSTGRIVANSDIENLLRDRVAQAERQMQTWAEQYARGDMTGRTFYELMQREIKLTTNANAALAKGGWAQMTPADWGANGAHLRKEYGYLRDFVAAVERGELTQAQIAARAASYSNNTYARYWQIKNQIGKEHGRTQKRLITVGDDRVCPVCRDMAGDGWIDINNGSYDPPVHPACRCGLEYR